MFTEDEGGKTAEENWDAIELVYSKASSRVTMVAACKASREDHCVYHRYSITKF